MKTFTPAFDAERSKKTGASPVWILECPFASGTLYLSDYVFTVPGWKGSGVATVPWIRSWGRINEDISGEMAGTRVSSFSATVLIDPGATPSIETILGDQDNDVEATDLNLYLWFPGLDAGTDPPCLMWRGNAVDWEKTDELVMRLDLSDVSVRLDRYVGTRLSPEEYPDACPDDVGKVLPVVYGADNWVKALRASWGSRTTLREAIDPGSTSCKVSLRAVTDLPPSGSVWCDDEKIGYDSITVTTAATDTTYTLTGLARGQSGTGATAHAAGAEVAQCMEYYGAILADHPLSTVKGIYAVIGNAVMAVSDGVSAGEENGRHVLTAGQNITVRPVENIAVIDPGHSHSNIQTANQYATSSSHLGDYGNWTWTGVDLNVRDSDLTTYLKATYTGTSYDTASITAGFPGYAGPAPSAVFAVITHQSFKGSNAPAGAYVAVNAVSLDTSNVKVTQRIALGTTVPSSIAVVACHPASAASYQVQTVVYEISLEINVTSTSTDLASVTKTGGIVSAHHVDHFIALVNGHADDASGSVTGTPGALIERPDHVAAHFLHTRASWPVEDFFSNGAPIFNSIYRFSIVVDRYERLKKWLGRMAWESRSYFRFAPSRAELLVRPDTPASVRTITASMTAMDNDLKTRTRVRRSPLEDVINRVQVAYNRDATKSGEDSCRSITAAVEDAASVARYGLREKPELFTMDFVQDAAMAADLRDFYLARCKDRKKVVETTVFLDNGDLEFADAVTLVEAGDILAEVQQVNISPGSGRDMTNDTIRLIAREY